MSDQKLELLYNWYRRIRIAQTGHYQESHGLRTIHFLLGIPVVLLSAIVGTGVFASLSEENTSPTWKILLGLISVLASALAALQTFLNYSEQSARHLAAAIKLSSLKKEIEENLVLLSSGSKEMDEFIKSIRVKWDAITTEAPLLSEKTFQRNFRKYGGEKAFPVMTLTDTSSSNPLLDKNNT